MVNIYCIYSDGGTWYPEACSSSLGLEHKLHTYLKKSLIERAIQYFKDRTENFDDDYYPCTKLGLCNLSHVYKWLGLFVFMRNARIENIKFRTLRNIIGGETS